MKTTVILVALMLALSGCGLVKPQKTAALTADEKAKLNHLLGEQAPPSGTALENLHRTTPDVLCAAFAENPLNADATYVNQWLRVTGKLDSGPLKKDSYGITSYALLLENKGQRIVCIFYGPEKEEQLKKLKKGQNLVVVGRYTSTERGPALHLCSLAPADGNTPSAK